MGRMFAGVVVVAILMVSMVALASGDPDANQPEFWGEDCHKIDESQGASWTADADYRLVVVKAGTVNHEFYNVKVGDVLSVGKDISHLILCAGEPESSTTTTTRSSSTSSPTTMLTTTTQTMESTTTEPSVTTTCCSAQPTTTTSIATTTVADPPTTTTTTVGTTTTTQAPTTTDPPKDLPLTGSNLIPPLALLALLLLMIGYLFVRRSRI